MTARRPSASARLPRPLARFPLLTLTVVASILSLLTACSPPDAEHGTKLPEGWPTQLQMAYSPSEEDVEGRMEMLDELAGYLGEAIGVPVRLIQAQGYGPTIEAMRAEKIDIARTGSFAYMIAHEKAGAQAIIARGTPAGPGLYTSIIVTSPSSGLRTMDDVIARAGELVFAFVDPASTSGHLMPRAGLESFGIDAEEDFRRIVFTMSHTNSAMALSAGKVDVGGMSRTSYDRLVAAGRVAEEDFVLLWESPTMPSGPIVVREGLPQALKERIRDAYLALNEQGGPLLEAIRTQARKPELIYHEADDGMWDGLREIARDLENMNLLGAR